jgi:plasmid replication initiation protein
VSGNLDPASPNAIDANGRVVLRFKVTQGGSFSDFTFTGQMQTSGRSIVGSVSGSGFAGQSVTFTK